MLGSESGTALASGKLGACSRGKELGFGLNFVFGGQLCEILIALGQLHEKRAVRRVFWVPTECLVWD
jgi:hypothetical protein